MTLLINILLGCYLVVALLMILVILMQRPKSEGLGAAFGGGVTENIFGAQTTNVLTKITGWLAAIFFLLSFGLSVLYAQKASTASNLQRELAKDLPSASPAPPSPTPGASAAGAIETSPTPGSSASPIGGTPAETAGSPSPAPSAVPSGNADATATPAPPAPSSTPGSDSASSSASPEAASATPAAHRRRRR